jgi:hypothetical protein
MNIKYHFENKRASTLREVTQIEAIIRTLNEVVWQLESDVAVEERRVGISDPLRLPNSRASADCAPSEFESDTRHARTAGRGSQAVIPQEHAFRRID